MPARVTRARYVQAMDTSFTEYLSLSLAKPRPGQPENLDSRTNPVISTRDPDSARGRGSASVCQHRPRYFPRLHGRGTDIRASSVPSRECLRPDGDGTYELRASARAGPKWTSSSLQGLSALRSAASRSRDCRWVSGRGTHRVWCCSSQHDGENRTALRLQHVIGRCDGPVVALGRHNRQCQETHAPTPCEQVHRKRVQG